MNRKSKYMLKNMRQLILGKCPIQKWKIYNGKTQRLHREMGARKN